MLTTLAVANYRSLRSLILPLHGLNVVTGANGSGKSSVYRALRLLADSARDAGMVPALAREGGFGSTLWAGPEEVSRAMRRGEQPVQGTGKRKEPINLKLGFAGDEFGYSVELGMPPPPAGSFAGDPHIKRECIWHGNAFRPAALLVDRRNAAVQIKGEGREWNVLTTQLSPYESMLSRLADPKRAPEVLLLREQIRSWRFYDHFRSDAAAPARLPQVGTYTPVLADDGADLAAALQTIIEIGDREALAHAVDDAFPGAAVHIERGGRFEVAMRQHGLLRALSAAELSDGTLRYLLWVAALLSPRPPALLVLNEPETSLHPDLLPALGRLIAHAARNTQVLVVSHAARLIATLEGERECNSLHLEKELGETRLAVVGEFDRPVWHWPPR